MPIGKGMKSAGARMAERSSGVTYAILTNDYVPAGRVLARKGERVRLIGPLVTDDIVQVYREGASYMRGVPGHLLKAE